MKKRDVILLHLILLTILAVALFFIGLEFSGCLLAVFMAVAVTRVHRVEGRTCCTCYCRTQVVPTILAGTCLFGAYCASGRTYWGPIETPVFYLACFMTPACLFMISVMPFLSCCTHHLGGAPERRSPIGPSRGRVFKHLTDENDRDWDLRI